MDENKSLLEAITEHLQYNLGVPGSRTPGREQVLRAATAYLMCVKGMFDETVDKDEIAGQVVANLRLEHFRYKNLRIRS